MILGYSDVILGSSSIGGDPRIFAGDRHVAYTPPASQSSERSGAHHSVSPPPEPERRLGGYGWRVRLDTARKLAPVSLSVSGLSDRFHPGIVPPG